MSKFLFLLCLSFIAVLVVLAYYIALWFFEVAEEKGYHSKKYFWICFWLGLIGYLLVIALPDRGNSSTDFGELPEL